MPTVALPNGQTAQFPDGMSPDDIQKAIESDPQFAPPPTTGQRAMGFLKDLGKGLGESAVGLMSTGDNAARKIPGIGEWLTTPITGTPADQAIAHTHELATPADTTQAVGKGIGNAAQFLIPGGLEERIAAGAPGMLAPALNIASSAVSSGLVNKAQGGSFGSGAAAGAAGSAIGSGLRAIAPRLAESAIGIRNTDRAFGKTPGRAILDETRGIRPDVIARTGQNTLNDLTPQVERMADAASVRRAPRIAGFLSPPVEETPLAIHPRQPNMSGHLFPAEVNPEEPMEARSGEVMAPISDYPGINPHYLSGSEHPELSGRVPTAQGVLRRRPEMSTSIPPMFEPNASASLAPARNTIGGAIGKAAQQEAGGLHSQLRDLSDFLHVGQVSGEPIDEAVTPRRLLDLQRGFSKTFLGRWNPETYSDTVSAGRQAYRAMGDEFDKTVPGAADLRQRMSSLIPVVHRAESTARNAPFAQKVIGRFAAPTGALTLAGIGGAEGYREGGGPGAAAGALSGLLAPLLIATPEGQMLMARGFNGINGLRPLVGSGLQFTGRKDTGDRGQ